MPVIAAALLAGCGAAASTGSTTSPTSANSGPSGPCVISGKQPTPAPTAAGNAAAASLPLQLPSPLVPLIVYSAQGYDSTITKAFTKATGIPVQLDDDSTGPLLAKVQAEKNNPSWDVLWVDGDTAFAALDQQAQLLPYQPSVQLNAAGESLVPADHSYVPVSTTIMASVIYNSAAVSAVPTSYADLLGSQYTGKVGMNDPSQSGPTFPFIAGLMNQLGGESNGVAAGERCLTALKTNGLHVFPTNGDTLHALETGQIDYGMIQSSAATGEVLKAASQPSSAYVPKIVNLPVSTLLPGVIGIDKNRPAANQAEAEAFVNYVLSSAGQAVMQTGDPTGDSLFWPIVPGISAVSGLPSFPMSYQKLDPYFWGPKESEVNNWFDTNIKT
ncbi:MAG TPA: extracellular solute-binding protein [Acidothermaceae bacterium]|nr:extracellular solute-binding protein [Acidothermaceae bacterium]